MVKTKKVRTNALLIALMLSLFVSTVTVFAGDYATETAPQNIGGITFGDVNNDGQINTSDVTDIRRYLEGWFPNIDKRAADIDANGVINAHDVTLLREYIAGSRVIEPQAGSVTILSVDSNGVPVYTATVELFANNQRISLSTQTGVISVLKYPTVRLHGL